MQFDALESAAVQLLEHAVDALDDPDVTAAIDALDAYGSGAPDRRFVSHTEPAIDCEVLTVHMSSLGPRAFEQQSSEKCVVVPTAQFCIQLWRCILTMEGSTPPAPEALSSESRALLIEAGALWRHLTGLWRDGVLLDGIQCRNVTWGAVEPQEPQGGFAGWSFCLTVRM